jgi:hypothetical protein
MSQYWSTSRIFKKKYNAGRQMGGDDAACCKQYWFLMKHDAQVESKNT